MAWFLVAGDCSIRRGETKRYNWQLREPEAALKMGFPPRNDGEAFTVHTRHYLRRRTWRYFRRLGFRDPKRYLAAVMEALVLYRDADVDSGVHLLDNWGLTHILFHNSPILRCKPHGWVLKDGEQIRDLKPTAAFATACPASSSRR